MYFCHTYVDTQDTGGEGEARLVNTVAQPSQLVNTGACLHIGVVPRPDGTHAGRLIPCVGLHDKQKFM